MRDQPVRHFLNDLVVGAPGLNGACVIALRGNTARNVREGRIIKTSTTGRLFAFMLFLKKKKIKNLEIIMNGHCWAALFGVLLLFKLSAIML